MFSLRILKDVVLELFFDAEGDKMNSALSKQRFRVVEILLLLANATFALLFSLIFLEILWEFLLQCMVLSSYTKSRILWYNTGIINISVKCTHLCSADKKPAAKTGDGKTPGVHETGRRWKPLRSQH